MNSSGISQAAISAAEVTDEQVHFYQENGWVHLPGFLDEQSALALKADLQESGIFDGQHRSVNKKFTTHERPSTGSGLARELVYGGSLALASRRLMRQRAVRLWHDVILVKHPVAETGGPTTWHQDWPIYSLDRAGSLNFWIALEDIPPERGTMNFLTGSHRYGPLGRVEAWHDGQQVEDVYAEIFDACDISPDMHMRPGDATAHNGLLLHRAHANQSSEPRWVYETGWFPANAMYNGAACAITDGLGLKVNDYFPDDPFVLFEGEM